MDLEIKRFLNQSVLCWVATVSESGQPNVSPKEVFVEYEGRLLIAHIASPKTIRNLQQNPAVCVSFVEVFVQKGFQLYGDARIVKRNDADWEKVHPPLFAIAGPDYPIAAVMDVTINDSKPIIAPRYKFFPEVTESDQIEAAHRMYGVEKRRSESDSD